MYGRRKRKDTLCVSMRHLKRLAAQESTIVSDILVREISSCDNMENERTTDLNNDCTVNSTIINVECNTE